MSNLTDQKKSKRIFYFDALRAFAIFFVILIHVSKWFVKNEISHSVFWIFSSSLASLGNIGVPIFFMISGALLLNRKIDLDSFYKKRFSRILIPFIFWIIIIIIFKINFLDYESNLNSVIDIIFFKGFVWYIWTILGLYLFTPIINSFILEYNIKGVEYFLIIWLITILLSTFNLYPIKNIELRYFSGFVGYFVLGWYLSNKRLEMSDKNIIIFSCLIFIISTIVTIFCINFNLLSDVYYLTIFPVVQSFSLYLLFKTFEDYSKHNISSLSNKFVSYVVYSKIGKIITSISVCSYGIYLTHYFVIWIVRITNNQTHILLRNPFKWIPFLVIITLLISWGLIWTFSKIPYLNKVSGT